MRSDIIGAKRCLEISGGGPGMKWFFRLVLALILLSSALFGYLLIPGLLVPLPEPEAAQTTRPANPEEWRAAALADLASAKKLLEDNTPIPFDKQAPHHRSWLLEGYEKARALASRAVDEHGHYFALSAYINGFQDPHIALDLTQTRPDPLWPGFIAAPQGEHAVVVSRDAEDQQAPAIGTKFLTCDGLSLEAFGRERILSFVGNEKIALSRRQTIPRIFLDRHNPFVPRASTCDFETAQGRQTLTLKWRKVPEDAVSNKAWFEALLDASTGPSARWGVSEPAMGVTWIGVPTFSSGEETAPKLKQLIADVEAKADAMRQGRAIVIDTRGNGGGNTFWSQRLAYAIFPDSALARGLLPSSKITADWRASAGNARFWRKTFVDYSSEFGPVTIESLGALYLAGTLWAHKDSKPPIWRFPFDPEPVASGGLTLKRPKSGNLPMPATVYFLSNGTCGSTCLNFADDVLMIPGVKLIGSATHADSAYMEVRNELLPSGTARLVFPQKVWRGMGRGSLEAYQPDIAYAGPWDDASVRAWVMQVVERGGE